MCDLIIELGIPVVGYSRRWVFQKVGIPYSYHYLSSYIFYWPTFFVILNSFNPFSKQKLFARVPLNNDNRTKSTVRPLLSV